MLPVVVCEEDRALRARWLSALEALARQLWRLEPVSGAVQRACAGVLAAGYRQLSG